MAQEPAKQSDKFIIDFEREIAYSGISFSDHQDIDHAISLIRIG